MIKSLKKVILVNSDRLNRIVQINESYDIYSVKVIELFDVEIVYAIYPRVYT